MIELEPSFLSVLNKYYATQRNRITEKEYASFNEMLDTFETSELCEFIILNNPLSINLHGSIQRVNQIFVNEFNSDISIVGQKFDEFVHDLTGNQLLLDTLPTQLSIAFTYLGQTRYFECSCKEEK